MTHQQTTKKARKSTFLRVLPATLVLTLLVAAVPSQAFLPGLPVGAPSASNLPVDAGFNADASTPAGGASAAVDGTRVSACANAHASPHTATGALPAAPVPVPVPTPGLPTGALPTAASDTCVDHDLGSAVDSTIAGLPSDPTQPIGHAIDGTNRGIDEGQGFLEQAKGFMSKAWSALSGIFG